MADGRYRVSVTQPNRYGSSANNGDISLAIKSAPGGRMPPGTGTVVNQGSRAVPRVPPGEPLPAFQAQGLSHGDRLYHIVRST